MAITKGEAPKPRTLKRMRADAPEQDRDLPVFAAPPAPPIAKPAKALSTTPMAAAYEALAALTVEFGDDAETVTDMLRWYRASAWWGQMNRQWGHPQTSMMAAETEYLLKGQDSRLPEVLPNDAERADYVREATGIRDQWEAAGCPGLLEDLDPLFVWVRKTIKQRNAA